MYLLACIGGADVLDTNLSPQSSTGTQQTQPTQKSGVSSNEGFGSGMHPSGSSSPDAPEKQDSSGSNQSQQSGAGGADTGTVLRRATSATVGGSGGGAYDSPSGSSLALDPTVSAPVDPDVVRQVMQQVRGGGAGSAGDQPSSPSAEHARHGFFGADGAAGRGPRQPSWDELQCASRGREDGGTAAFKITRKMACEYAAQCCLDLHRHLSNFPTPHEDAFLNLHIGVGYGIVKFLQVCIYVRIYVCIYVFMHACMHAKACRHR
eukprot:GHVU01011151.1.p1 GENE.GHVU01011151.1~~GHVU01011151.1.p1  ORF type:complete len:263 (+),score=35.98 GHVU01011151.1:311-1099(+)